MVTMQTSLVKAVPSRLVTGTLCLCGERVEPRRNHFYVTYTDLIGGSERPFTGRGPVLILGAPLVSSGHDRAVCLGSACLSRGQHLRSRVSEGQNPIFSPDASPRIPPERWSFPLLLKLWISLSPQVLTLLVLPGEWPSSCLPPLCTFGDLSQPVLATVLIFEDSVLTSERTET